MLSAITRLNGTKNASQLPVTHMTPSQAPTGGHITLRPGPRNTLFAACPDRIDGIRHKTRAVFFKGEKTCKGKGPVGRAAQQRQVNFANLGR